MEDLFSESNFCMTEMWPPVPPVTREALTAEPGAGGGGGCGRQSPDVIGFPQEVQFGGIDGSSSSSSSDDSCTSNDRSNSNDGGDLPAACGETCAEHEGFRRAHRTAKRTNEVPVVELDHEHVLRGCPADVSQEDS